MPQFVITITETLMRRGIVHADTAEEAIEQTTKLYKAEAIVLDEDDIYEVVIEEEKEIDS